MFLIFTVNLLIIGIKIVPFIKWYIFKYLNGDAFCFNPHCFVNQSKPCHNTFIIPILFMNINRNLEIWILFHIFNDLFDHFSSNP